MKVGAIVNRYVFLEMIPPFVVNLVLFTFIFLMAKILDITDLVVNYGVSLSSVLLMLACSIPSFLVFVVPMSIMMGVLLAFLRLSHDNEIVALKAGGVSVYRLLPPVLVFCLMGCLITGFMGIYGSPWGRLGFRAILLETATSNAEVSLRARAFNDAFKDVMLYVSEIDPHDKSLRDVFIEDRQTPGMVSIVVAPKGRFHSSPETLTYRLTLFNGIINQVDVSDKTVHAVHFDSYNFDLGLSQVLSEMRQRPKGKKEMSLAELRQAIKEIGKEKRKYYTTLMEYQRKFSIPIACFVLGLIGMPLGIQSKYVQRSFGMVLGLFFFLMYYILMSAGWICGESRYCPPFIAVWGPNVVIGVLGLYLLMASARERPSGAVSLLLKLFTWPKSARRE